MSRAPRRLALAVAADGRIAASGGFDQSRMTPGTKMPEQIVGDPADREALVRFLARATANP